MNFDDWYDKNYSNLKEDKLHKFSQYLAWEGCQNQIIGLLNSYKKVEYFAPNRDGKNYDDIRLQYIDIEVLKEIEKL